MLAFSIRNVPVEFKESLGFPIYSFLIINIITKFVSLQSDSLILNDSIESIGIIIHSLFVIFFIYIMKFYLLNVRKTIEKNTSSRQLSGVIITFKNDKKKFNHLISSSKNYQ
ncbi:hypothetical protein PIROE2DRAFT_2657 [Piromyces sp. E2]|nr:hypothetical protein PIROE2DRAFT_2657 [Piromyces sp. E2]|eukprot:OUM69363.1 hypothetical protein PIROE2DRAFT_2657 [Piromyces sp. E2]